MIPASRLPGPGRVNLFAPFFLLSLLVTEMSRWILGWSSADLSGWQRAFMSSGLHSLNPVLVSPSPYWFCFTLSSQRDTNHSL